MPLAGDQHTKHRSRVVDYGLWGVVPVLVVLLVLVHLGAPDETS